MDENDQEVVDDMQGENYQEEYSVDRSSNVSGDSSPRSEDGEVASNSPIRSPDNEYPGSPNNDEFENPDDQQLNASKRSFTQEDIGSPGADNPSSPVSPGSGVGADRSRSGSPFDGNAGPYSPNSPVDGDIASPRGSASPQSPVPDDGIASPESPRQHGYSPRSPVCSIPHSPLSAASSNRSRRSQHSVLNEDAAELHQQSSPAGELNESHDRAESPAENRSRSASPNVNRSRSWSRSLSGSRNSSLSPAREGSAHSRSPAGSPARSHNSSPPRSPDGSPSRNQSSLPAGSPVGSPCRGRSGSPVRSRSVSPVHSRSVSPVRSRSGSSARSRSGSQARSRSGSPARSRSRSGSPARSRSVSPVRSKSGSPARSGSGSPVIQRKKRNRLSGSDRSRSNSPGVASNRSQSGSPERSSKKGGGAEEGQAMFDNESDNEGSDKGSAVGELIADIFGSSDEEEFEGFGNEPDESAAKKDKKKKPKDTNEEVLPDLSDDDVDESGKRHAPDFVSDFDLMLERKKEEMRKRRRKRKDVDIINDNDDLIDDMIRRMKVAAEDDRNLNQQKKPAVKKLGMLPKILPQLKKADLHNAFLDGGILNAITEWLAPLPDKSLPHLQIREAMLRQLMEFPTISSEGLKMSGVGKAVMYLYKHPKEIRTNKEMAGKLINEWSRPIFNLTSNYKNLSRQEREERDYEQLPKKRRISLDGATPRRDIDKALAGDEKVLRPGDPGYVYRARVPQPSVRDYVIRPKWNVEEKSKAAGKKQITKYEKHVRAQKRKSTTMKVQRAVPMSIEGRNMSL